MARYIDAEWIALRLVNMAEASEKLYPGLMTAYYQITAAPTADVRSERHAEWVMDNGRFKCSNCNASVDDPDGFPYCPHCGAKMSFGGNQ